MIRRVTTGVTTRVRCPQGHKDDTESWIICCSECGLKLDREEEPCLTLMCDVCGTTNVDKDMKYCPSCGAIATKYQHLRSYEEGATIKGL